MKYAVRVDVTYLASSRLTDDTKMKMFRIISFDTTTATCIKAEKFARQLVIVPAEEIESQLTHCAY